MSADPFSARDAARWIAAPRDDDDKYSRGVVGFVTGSETYPGAAVLGVEAALRTGVGMVRYLGAPRPTELVLQRRPEAVVVPGRVQAWVLGSGQEPEIDGFATRMRDAALADALPTVLDGGALHLHEHAPGPRVLTPHARELARLRGLDLADVGADPAAAALDAARRLDAVVLLKGNTTHLADADGSLLSVRAPTAWLATAGTGDALAGVLGALLATHHLTLGRDPGALLPIAAAGVVIHGLAAERAGGGGPFTVLDLCAALSAVVAGLVGG